MTVQCHVLATNIESEIRAIVTGHCGITNTKIVDLSRHGDLLSQYDKKSRKLVT